MSLGVLNRYLKPLSIGAVLLVISFSPVGAFSLLVSVLLWAMYWPFSRGINSVAIRFILSLVLATCYLQLIAALAWLVGLSLPLPLAVFMILIVVPILLVVKGRSKGISLITRSDVTALLVSGLSVAVIVIGMIGSGPLLPQLLKQITTGYDGTYHLSLSLSLYEEQGLVYGNYDDVADKVIAKTLNFYPQSWSHITSLWWQGIGSDIDIKEHPTRVLVLYASSMLAWYFMLVFLFCRLTLYLLERRLQSLNTSDYVGVALSTALIQVLLFIALLSLNFATFFTALVFPLALAYLTFDMLCRPHEPSQLRLYVISASLICAGIAFSWLITAPAAYLTVLVALVFIFDNSVRKVFPFLLKNRKLLLVLLATTGLALIQIYVQVRYGESGLINYTGGITQIHGLSFTLFTALTVALFVVTKSRLVKQAITATLIGPVLTVIVVYYYQLYAVGEARYYTTKLLYLVFMFVGMFAIIAAIHAYRKWVAPNMPSWLGILTIAIAVLFVPLVTNANLNSGQEAIGAVNYISGKRYLSDPTASQLADLVASGKVNDANVVIFKQYIFNEDLSTTHFLNTLKRAPLSLCEQAIEDQLRNEWSLNKSAIIECSRDRTYYIITSPRSDEGVRLMFNNWPNVQVITSNY